MFLIARRQVDVGGTNQELMYMSLKFINNIWVLAEVKVAPGSTTLGVRLSTHSPLTLSTISTTLPPQLALKTSAMDVVPGVQEAFGAILHN